MEQLWDLRWDVSTQAKNININGTNDVSLALQIMTGTDKVNVAIITKAAFRLLKNNANNSSWTSLNQKIQC
jgi:hypothetical protein